MKAILLNQKKLRMLNLLSSFLLVFIIGCSNSEAYNRKVKTIYNNNGERIKEYHVTKSGLKDGDYKEFYVTGEISAKMTMCRGKKEGVSIQYHKNGSVKSVVNYVNGLAQGKAIWFNEYNEITKIVTYLNDTLKGVSYSFIKDGKLDAIYYRLDSVNNGPQYLYYENGILEKYSCIVNGKQIYYKKYDNTGAFLKEEGTFIVSINIDSERLEITLVNPPGADRSIKIYKSNYFKNCNFENKEMVLEKRNTDTIKYSANKLHDVKEIGVSIDFFDLQTQTNRNESLIINLSNLPKPNTKDNIAQQHF